MAMTPDEQDLEYLPPRAAALFRVGNKKTYLAQKFILDSKNDLVVLDEVNCCLDYGFLKVDPILQVLREKPLKKHVILTGRGAPKKLIQFSGSRIGRRESIGTRWSAAAM